MIATILDTGPLVAYFDKRDQWHGWAVALWPSLHPPLITCEAVLTETCFLCQRAGLEPTVIVELLATNALRIDLAAQDHAIALAALMRAYADAPMSLADACLVRLSELHHASRVLTLDRHFARYRRSGRRIIPLLSPW